MDKGIALLCGTEIPPEWIFKPITQLAGHGRLVGVVDGENSFRSYRIARYARELNVDARTALENVKLSRAFTCYQLAELITQKLDPLVEAGCAGIVCLGLLGTLYDEDVLPSEAQRLLQSITAHLKRLAERVPLLVTVRPPPSRVQNRTGLVHALMQQVDSVYVLEPGPGKALPGQGLLWPQGLEGAPARALGLAGGTARQLLLPEGEVQM